MLDAVAGGLLITGVSGPRSGLVGAWVVLLAAGAVALRFPRAGVMMTLPRGMEALLLSVGALGHGHLWVGWFAATAALFMGLAAASYRRPREEVSLVSAPEFSHAEVARATAYQRGVRAGTQLASLSWPGAISATAFAASRVGIRQDIERLPWIAALPAVVLAAHVLASAPLLVFSAYRGLRLDPAFGMATQSARHWWRDARRDLIAGMSVAIVSALLVWGAVRLVSPWWFGAAMALSAVALAVFGTYPLRFG